MTARIENLRDLRTSLSRQVQFLESEQRRLIELGFAKTLLDSAINQVEVALSLVVTAVDKEIAK